MNFSPVVSGIFIPNSKRESDSGSKFGSQKTVRMSLSDSTNIATHDVVEDDQPEKDELKALVGHDEEVAAPDIQPKKGIVRWIREW